MKTECTHCGGQIEFDEDSSGMDAPCPHCGQMTRLTAGLHKVYLPLTFRAPPPVPPPILPPLSSSSVEQIFLDEAGVVVTKSRFITGSRTYLLSGVTSIREAVIAAQEGGVIALFIIGSLLLSFAFFFLFFRRWWLAGTVAAIIGCGIIILANAYEKRLRPTFAVMLTTAAQEVRTLESPDSAFIARVVDALNKAVIARG